MFPTDEKSAIHAQNIFRISVSAHKNIATDTPIFARHAHNCAFHGLGTGCTGVRLGVLVPIHSNTARKGNKRVSC